MRRHIVLALINQAYTPGYDVTRAPRTTMSASIPDQALLAMRTADGDTLASLAARGPLLLVFLRHFGCPLCQEMVADVAARRTAMADSGTTVVFVHMHPEPQAAAFFARYGVSDLQRVSDPARTLYRAFGVPRARPTSWLSLGSLRHYLVGDAPRPPAETGRRRRRPDVGGGPHRRRPHRP